MEKNLLGKVWLGKFLPFPSSLSNTPQNFPTTHNVQFDKVWKFSFSNLYFFPRTNFHRLTEINTFFLSLYTTIIEHTK